MGFYANRIAGDLLKKLFEKIKSKFGNCKSKDKRENK